MTSFLPRGRATFSTGSSFSTMISQLLTNIHQRRKSKPELGDRLSPHLIRVGTQTFILHFINTVLSHSLHQDPALDFTDLWMLDTHRSSTGPLGFLSGAELNCTNQVYPSTTCRCSVLLGVDSLYSLNATTRIAFLPLSCFCFYGLSILQNI